MPVSFLPPVNYTTAPPWPSLYWPFGPDSNPPYLIADVPHSLYFIQDIWRYIVLWSIFFTLSVYLPAGIWAFAMLTKAKTLPWCALLAVPVVFCIAGCIASFFTASITGVAIALLYNSGYFVMSTWIPFLWALIQILLIIIGCYNTMAAIF